MKTIILLICLAALVIGLIYYFSNKKTEKFTDKKTSKLQKEENPLYASHNVESKTYVHHISPAGDKDAMKKGGVGIGTSGGFLPLQGDGSQIFMANSNKDNTMKKSSKVGKIGSFDNYDSRDHISTRMDGVEDFGIKDKTYTNSHLINGANERVINYGQKGDLKCNDFWPSHDKDNSGYCVTGNDNINHPDFIDFKTKTRWEKVLGQ